MAEKDEALFTISVVAQRFDLHPQTLRVYEREGLISPRRSSGNTRLYSEADMERIRVILSLTRDLGVNLAGVDVILRLKEQLRELERERDEILRFIVEEVRAGRRTRQGLVRTQPGKPWRNDG